MTNVIDRRQVRRNFQNAAVDYDRRDFFAREIDRRMQERLDYLRLAPQRILDLGCSRGASLEGLGKRYPQAERLGIDLVPEMLAGKQRGRAALFPWGKRAATPQFVAADAAALPLAANSVDLIWSNLLLHWLEHPLPAFREALRTLRVGGLLMFATLGPDTLQEVRTAFGDEGAHTQRFTDLHDLGDMLLEAGFADPVMDMEKVTLTYASLPELLAELRGSGGRCALQSRQKGLAGRGLRRRFDAGYAAQQQEGRYPVSFEVIYGHAWKAEARQASDGRSIVRFMERPKT